MFLVVLSIFFGCRKDFRLLVFEEKCAKFASISKAEPEPRLFSITYRSAPSVTAASKSQGTPTSSPSTKINHVFGRRHRHFSFYFDLTLSLTLKIKKQTLVWTTRRFSRRRKRDPYILLAARPPIRALLQIWSFCFSHCLIFDENNFFLQ